MPFPTERADDLKTLSAWADARAGVRVTTIAGKILPGFLTGVGPEAIVLQKSDPGPDTILFKHALLSVEERGSAGQGQGQGQGGDAKA